ncbi:MAG: MnhB domain-containing protein [archaeon]
MKEMSVIVRVTAALMTAPILIFGMYQMMHGHLTPGGGFPGGAIAATAVAMLLVAYGGDRFKTALKKDTLAMLESIGLLGFILLALHFGPKVTLFKNIMANTGGLFGTQIAYGINPGNLNTAGHIPLMELAVGLEVFAALSIIIYLMYTAGGANET